MIHVENKNQKLSLYSFSGCIVCDDRLIFCIAIILIPSLGATTITSLCRVRRRSDIKLSVGLISRIADRAISAKASNFGVNVNVTLLSSDV
jgi:hypothetical protein